MVEPRPTSAAAQDCMRMSHIRRFARLIKCPDWDCWTSVSIGFLPRRPLSNQDQRSVRICANALNQRSDNAP
jgi:hypothetical protein